MCRSTTVLVWDLGMIWRYVSSVGDLLDAAGENNWNVGYPGEWGVVISTVFIWYTYVHDGGVVPFE
jgi:hypothetical protein